MSDLSILKGCFVNGQFRDASHSQGLTIKNKYSGDTFFHVYKADDTLIEQTLTSATSGFKALKSLSAGARSEGLLQLASLLKQHKSALTDIIIAEAGKPRGYASVEVDRGIATLEAAAHEALTFGGELINVDHHNGAGREALTKRFPKGPVFAISPFNFPLNLALHKIAPALAVGCPVILKPSSMTPVSALYLAHLFSQTSLPQEALQVICCNNDQAEFIMQDKRVAMVSFTGSDKVGWHIKKLVSNKPVALELGGNAAVIVDKNADIEDVAPRIVKGAYLYSGQICISTQRIYAHESLYEPLKEAMIEEISQLKIGDPELEKTLIGPLISDDAYDKVSKILDEAINAGAEVLAKTPEDLDGINVHPAVLLTNTDPQSAIIQEEVFGPLCALESVSNIEEAVNRVNDCRYGLQAGIFSQEIPTMKKCFNELEVGGVIMNDIPGFRVDSMPYGGVKDSGVGREGPRYAMEEMTDLKLLIY